MCKYCMLTWANHQVGDMNELCFDERKEGLDVELTIDHDGDDPVLYVYAEAYDYEGGENIIMTNMKIHYCPFCGQKLDLEEVN